jgi:hypothetical protein
MAGRQQGLDRDPGARVGGQEGVEQGVADLVGELVRMSLGHGLRGEKASGHVSGYLISSLK